MFLKQEQLALNSILNCIINTSNSGSLEVKFIKRIVLFDNESLRNRKIAHLFESSLNRAELHASNPFVKTQTYANMSLFV